MLQIRTTIVATATAALAIACTDGRIPVGPKNAAVSTSQAAVPTQSAIPVPGRYIVRLREGVSDIPGVAEELRAHVNGRIRHTYSSALRAFVVDLPDSLVQLLRSDPRVAYVDQDQVITLASPGTELNAPFNLDRIDQHALPLNGSYNYPGDGTGVTIYIVDSGIKTMVPDFGGRASIAYDVQGGSGIDCNGHGTHVAGIAGGTQYGVAKGASLAAVRVTQGCTGNVAVSDEISGLDWLAGYHVPNAVANMSISGPQNNTVDAAVRLVVSSGVAIAVAVGNDQHDACKNSPSTADVAIRVTATDANDQFASSFANYGVCVDIAAPGVNVTSDWNNPPGYQTLSGTSMASPHAAGIAAILKGLNSTLTPAAIKSAIVNQATAGVIGSLPSGTPNRLVYIGS